MIHAHSCTSLICQTAATFHVGRLRASNGLSAMPVIVSLLLQHGVNPNFYFRLFFPSCFFPRHINSHFFRISGTYGGVKINNMCLSPGVVNTAQPHSWLKSSNYSYTYTKIFSCKHIVILSVPCI